MRSYLPSAFVVALLAMILAACAGDGSGIPEPMAPGCQGLEPRFSCIQEFVFTPTCAVSNCHDVGTSSVGLTLEAGLAYQNLVGVNATEAPSLLRVDPNNPDDSYLLIKLEGSDPRLVAGRMPLGQASLPADQIQAIREWIANGANDD